LGIQFNATSELVRRPDINQFQSQRFRFAPVHLRRQPNSIIAKERA